MTKWRIMIVDDDEDARELIRAILQSQYEMVEAHDGLDALEKIERYQPDLIIMDVVMPLMDGLEASTAIRENPKFNHIPILFLSAKSQKEDMEKGYLSGADLYITKPLEPFRLVSVIQNFIKKKSLPIEKKQYTVEQLSQMEISKVEVPAQPIPSQPGDTEFQKIAARQPIPYHRPSAYEQPSLKQLPRVMVVDDEKDMLEFLRLALRDQYEVIQESDSIEAIKKVVSYQPDLFILDIMLPKMSGFQFCQSLRRNITFKDSPIVMISAKSSKKDQEYAFRMGADAYVIKPFSPKDLLKVIKEVIQKRNISIRSKTLSIDYIQKKDKDEQASIEAKEERVLKRTEEKEKS